MMRFMCDFEKADRSRHMGYTLQFMLSMDMMLTAVGYYVMKFYGQLELLDEYFYNIWMVLLAITLVPLALTSPVTFAKIRFVYRFLHMLIVTVIFIQFGHFLVPPCYVVYYSFELVYLHKGIGYGEMNLPGKWMTKLVDRYQEAKEQKMESARFPHIDLANEIIRKECSIQDEYIEDDLFDYHTACEDDLFSSMSPSSSSKRGSVFIV